ncbi:glycosyltransferase family 4 protein [Halomarina ordinaria]|uniref:Glycosyltransferase family 4 protein n=1 Tax=Halomarina ordinaria TaxID=3033939 RepID=A0ABD5U3H1_9EURY|nr:glycosyltransferase family 4 protein [Halomarina sp. PSRA2]
MRILRVAQKVYPEVRGGGPYHVHALSRDQAAAGHDVTVLTLADDDEEAGVTRRDGYRVVKRAPTTTLAGNGISLGVANYLRRADEFDVVHAHSHLYFSTNLAALRRRVGGPPLAITNHGLYSQNAPEWVFDAYLKSLGRWTFNRADRVFCYTDVDRRRVREFDVGSEIRVVSNGIDTERYAPEGPESDLVDPDVPSVVFVGRLVEGKRPETVLRAVDRLAATFPDVTLYLCGEGPLEGDLRRLAGELAADVEFLGYVDQEEMPAVYRSADAMMLPSRAEGVPRTVLESLASGTPVVASDLEQVRTVDSPYLRLVPLDDVSGFTSALETFLRERPDDVDLSPEYRWDRTVEETTRELRALVG